MAIKEAPKTHTQHAVPQNIMDVEFKLIGDLTMRQFTYLMVFGLAAYIVFMTMVGIFKLPLTLFFVLFGLTLAFIPIQERGMDEWFVNFFKAVYSPTQRVWKREPVLPPAFTYQSLAVVKQELITLAPTSSRRKLEDYLHAQQTTAVVDKLDIPEREYILMVRQALAPVSVGVDVVEEEFEVYKPFEPQQEQPQPEKPQEEKEPPKEEEPKKEEKKEKPKFEEQQAAPKEEKPEQKPRMQQTPQSPIVKTKPQQRIKSTAPTEDKITPKHEHTITSKIIMPRRSVATSMVYSPMTPDMHIGRKFTNVLPAEGQLILPVRGEKVIATSEEIDIQKDIEDKTAQLRRLLDQVQQDKDLGPMVDKKQEEKQEEKPPETEEARKSREKRLGEMPVPPSVPLPAPEVRDQKHKTDVKIFKGYKKPDKPKVDLAQIRKEAREKRQKFELAERQKQGMQPPQPQEGELSKAQEVAERVKQENEYLSNKIQKLKSEVEGTQESEEAKEEKRKLIETLEQERNKKSSDYSALQKQVLELQNRIKEQEAPQKSKEPEKPSYSKMEPITNEPNIISGVIRDNDNDAISGVVLLIKNHKGEAVRALKTNALGQFSISTSLVNGMYTLEVGSTIEGTSFDIITIEVKGEVLPPVELVGREV